jgi:FtsZ-binding cell division protein ZapB
VTTDPTGAPQLTSSVRRRLTKNEKKSAAVVITRPPEIVTCVKISIPGDADVFMIFDSHPRPDHPDGAGFIFSTSIDATARYLDNLLAIDESILSDHTLQWQTQLLANFSGLLFIAKSSRFDRDAIEAERAMIESSLTILALQAEVAELKSQNVALQSELQAAEVKTEEERWNSYRSQSSPKSSKKSSESVWTLAPTKKKHRKRKGDKSSSGPTDYRPSMPSPIYGLS